MASTTTPTQGVSKGEYVLWVDLTNKLVSLGGLTAGSTITVNLVDAATEIAAI